MAKVILFNKPFNVLCQFTDKQRRETLADFIPNKGVYPAGRLDYDSEGLVILTDCGRLQHQISHPSTKMSKTYWVQVEGIPTARQLRPLTQGVKLKDGRCRPAQVKLMEEPAIWSRSPPIRQRQNQPTSWLEIIISEGKNRQVRRMTASIGFPTLRLIRTCIGVWSLDNLPSGAFKEITVHAPVRQIPTRRHTIKGNRPL